MLRVQKTLGILSRNTTKGILHENRINYQFIQDNQSFSKRVIRGLHLQINPFAQAKLITGVRGEILDVAA
jgi:dTDP-4-dehydrorhamnose 3,5-epimerase